jgi:hypothetical protein
VGAGGCGFCAITGKLPGKTESIQSPASGDITSAKRAARFIERPQLTPCSRAPG